VAAILSGFPPARRDADQTLSERGARDVDAGQRAIGIRVVQAMWADPRLSREFAMADTRSKSLTPRSQLPFVGDVEQFFRMTRSWPFNWPDFAGGERALRAFEHEPRVEVRENGKSYTVTVELPGLDEKDVKVQVGNDVLTISGEKKIERSDEKTHYSERTYGSFTRVFTLPLDADHNAISARFSKGVLTLAIPKTETPSAQVKQIDIKST
jgi:HSP20 family protein